MNTFGKLSLVFLLGCVGLPAQAEMGEDLKNIITQIRQHETQNDPDGLAREPLVQANRASCAIGAALAAGLGGNPSALSQALSAAEESLRSVAERLPAVIEKVKYNKPARMSPDLAKRVSAEHGDASTGSDVLKAIASLAKQSADAIDRLRKGQGSEDDFSLVASNSALISQLVLAFYNLSVA